MPRLEGHGFTFNGVTSKAMNVRLVNKPSLPRAGMRGKAVTIPGRNGDLWVSDDCYDPVELNLKCRLLKGADPSRVSAWLTGLGDLVLGDEPDYCYKARAVALYNYERVIGTLSNFQIKITAQPFRYEAAPEIITRFEPGIVQNKGTAPSEPILTVFGNGAINLMVGGTMLMLGNVSGEITIDCGAKLAYKKGSLGTITMMNNTVSGDWPSFPVGNIPIQWQGGVQKIEIQPNWRWI